MSDKLVEKLAKAIEKSQVKWIGVDPGSPLFCKSVARAILPIIEADRTRQRNAGRDEAAVKADKYCSDFAEFAQENRRRGEDPSHYVAKSNCAGHLAKAIRASKEPEL